MGIPSLFLFAKSGKPPFTAKSSEERSGSGPRGAGAFEDRGGIDWSKSYKPGNRIDGLGKKDQFGSHTALTSNLDSTTTALPSPSPPRGSTTRTSWAGSLPPLRLSNASQGSNENMWVNALCKLQTAKQRVIIMLVNYTPMDVSNRNKTAPQTTAELCPAADFWWLSEVKTSQGWVASGLNPYISIYPNCLYEPIYRCADH